MPRTKREKAETGLYHIVQESVKDYPLWKTAEEKEMYLLCLGRARRKYSVHLLGYVLFPGVIHLILDDEGKGNVSSYLRYAHKLYFPWYRKKKKLPERTKLIRDRFRSEALTEMTLGPVLRELHYEPVRKGLCQEEGEYPWSSFTAYMTEGKEALVETNEVQAALHFTGGVKKNLTGGGTGYPMLREYPRGYGIKDEKAREMVEDALERWHADHIGVISEREKRQLLKRLHWEEGVPYQQLSRVSGVSRHALQRL